MVKLKPIKNNSKILIKKINSKNKFKSIKKSILHNGKKEFKLLPKLILMHLLKFISMIENLKLIKSSNGLLLLSMENHKINIIGLISDNKSLSEMKGKTLEKDWAKLMRAMLNKNKESKLLISWKISIKLLLLNS